MIEGKYKTSLSPYTGSYHYEAWVEDNGVNKMLTTGCSINTHAFDMNRRSCERQAKRAAKRLMRQYRRQLESGEPEVKTVTFDGKPSYADLQNRIEDLERELQI